MVGRLDLGRLDLEADLHGWLFPDPGENRDADTIETDPVVAVEILRDYLDQLHEASASFKRKFVVEHAEDLGYDGVNQHWFSREVMWLCNCWKIPSHYNDGGTRASTWINPQYLHRDQYSPVTVSCECGGVVTRIKSNGSGYGIETEHSDDCYPGWRAEAAGRLMENRRILLTRLGLLAKSARANHDLFHCEQNQVSHYVKSCGVDYERVKKIGAEQRKNTMIRLFREGYTTAQVACVYDLSASRVREIISNDTDHSIRGLKP